MSLWLDLSEVDSRASRVDRVLHTHPKNGGSAHVPRCRRTDVTVSVLDLVNRVYTRCVLENAMFVQTPPIRIFDSDDIDDMEDDGVLEGLVVHEMGHVIGIG